MAAVRKELMVEKQRGVFPKCRQQLRVLFLVGLVGGVGTTTGPAATLLVSNLNPSGAGSLQQAILDANATNGLDTIIFQIPGTGVRTISLTSALPSVTDPVVIDGTTQPGYAGTPLIELDGTSAGTTSDGLRVAAGGTTIRGLAINRFGGAGIHLQAPGVSNFIQGNFIGTDPTGTQNRGNGQASTRSGGIWIDGSSGNTIGGPYATSRNVISANGGSGIFLLNCYSNVIQGNLVGTTVSGTAALGNTTNGISLYNARGNLIGGSSDGTRNVVSGNSYSGIQLYGTASTANLVQGNYLGTDLSGASTVPNGADGITIQGAPGNTVGGTSAGMGNLVSGNNAGGISLQGPSADNNLIQGNLVGTDATGRVALGNMFSGITILSGNNNAVGGTTASARNVVSGNKLAGVFLAPNSAGNVIQGNLIGVDITGSSVLGNNTNGISINAASGNTVGGTVPGARNVISGNGNHGIEIFNTAASGNLVQGNYIGPNTAGQAALANSLSGVHIQAPGNTIGGAASGAGNLISGNAQFGIWLDGANALSNVVQGNYIGTTASGTSPLNNIKCGVGISDSAGNTIGGTLPGAGNLISANGTSGQQGGIFLIGGGATRNTIQGNKIGTDVTGTVGLGNRYEGIYLEAAPTNTIGGAAAGAGNVISANTTRGIYLVNAPGNVIQGNSIGTAIDGASGLGNVYHSIECAAGAGSTTIGGSGTAGNRIAFAQTVYAGVRIRDGSANNAIMGNSIFSNGALGIDLGGVGTNSLTACGQGSGANLSQNCPVLTQVVSGNGTGIRGTLTGKANSSFLLEFFSNPACDTSGAGEGRFYLGQQAVVTGNNCLASFVVNLPVQLPPGYVVTATATDGANNTSEFSACVPFGPVPTLSVRPAANNQLLLSWPSASGFVLKGTSSLTPPVQWATVTNAPSCNNGQCVVTLPASGASQFYVLSFE